MTYRFSLDTARNPDDVMHDLDGNDVLGTSAERPPTMLGFALVRIYHGAQIRTVQAFNFNVMTDDVGRSLARLVEDRMLPTPDYGDTPWEEIDGQVFRTFRAQWAAQCLTCPKGWRVDVVVHFAPIVDLIRD